MMMMAHDEYIGGEIDKEIFQNDFSKSKDHLGRFLKAVAGLLLESGENEPAFSHRYTQHCIQLAYSQTFLEMFFNNFLKHNTLENW